MVLVCPVHPAKTLEKLNLQRLSSSFTDLTVIVAGQQFTVHKCLLAAYSTVFCSVLQDAALGQTTPNINVDGVESEYFSIIIDFIYTSELKATPTNVDQLHATAHFLQMPEVMELCNKLKKQKIDSSQDTPLNLARSDTAEEKEEAANDVSLSGILEEESAVPPPHQPMLLGDQGGENQQEQKNPGSTTVEVIAPFESMLPDESDEDQEESIKNDAQEMKKILSPEELEEAKKQKKRGRKRQERVTCDVCSKVMTRNQYEAHKRVHTGEKPYKCTLCGKQFVTIYNLRIHERVHTGERPYSCDLCHKRFSDPSTMRKHKLWHAGVKNKRCEMCGKYFASLTQVREHMRSHTKEKPYACTLCGKAYGYRCDLKRHMREHTGNLIGPCSFCGKYFNHRGNFLSHTRLHKQREDVEPQVRLQDSGLVTTDGRFILKAKICDDPDNMSSTMLMVPDQGVSGIHGNRGGVSLSATSADGHQGDQNVLKVNDLSQSVDDGEIEVTINNGKFYVKHSTNGQDGAILDGSQIIIEDDASVTSTSSSPQQNQLFNQHVGTTLSADQVLMLVQHAQDLEMATSSSIQSPKGNISDTEDGILLTSVDEGKPVVIIDDDIS